MTKKLLTLIPLSLMAVALTACQPTMRSMGAAVEAAPIIHRENAQDKDSHLQIDVQGQYSGTNESVNVRDARALGGAASVTYRLGGSASFMFFNASVAGFGGRMYFACTESDCEDESDRDFERYRNWLATSSGQDKYSFINVQERVLAGMDFNIGPFFLIGFAGGAQFFQGSGEYDDKRAALDFDGIVDDYDGKYGLGFTGSMWMGFHLGEQGQYGTLSAEFAMLFKGNVDTWTNTTKVTYWHPTGFYGGVTIGDLIQYNIYAGKTFTF